MFTPDDFWRILRVLKDSTDVDPALDPNTKMLAESEQQTCRQFFLGTIDQIAHLSDDYKRLRTFLIDWYASHKTITSTQKHISDVYSLPSEHVSELIRSFGFEHGLNLVPLRNKVNMFLDLVNLYKKKGTPEALADILDYFGFSDADIIEYWLQKNPSGNLIFRGRIVRRAATGSTALVDEDVSFETMTQNDPHWMLSEAQIHSMFDQNKINFPVKTPYFSLSSVFSMCKLDSAMAILPRIIQDQYERKVINGLDIPQDIQIKGDIGVFVSLLELYTATIYSYKRMFGITSSTSDLNFLCYDGIVNYTADPPTPINLGQIALEYEDLVSVPPIDRDDRESKLITFFDNWSRLLSTNIFNTGGDVAGNILSSINPDLKNECDLWFAQGEEDYLVSYLIGTIDNWIRTKIDSQAPSLVVTLLGFAFGTGVTDIINVFKPYRARLTFLDTAYAILNPLTESVRLGDELISWVYQSHMDQLEFLDYFTIPEIQQSFVDTIAYNCAGSHYTNYDIGDNYDDFMIYCDLLEITSWSGFEDDVNITDNCIISEDKEFFEYPRGSSHPEMWDSGNYFDAPVQAPIVEDREHVEIVPWPPYPDEELEETFHDYARGTGGPMMWDIGNTFDEDIQAPIVTDSIEIVII